MFTLYYIMNHFPAIVNSEIATYYGVEAQNAIRVLTAERFGGIICRLMPGVRTQLPIYLDNTALFRNNTDSVRFFVLAERVTDTWNGLSSTAASA